MAANGDYTAIISDRQRERLLAMVDDARDKGALVTVVNPADEAFEAARKMPMHIVTDVQDDMHLMREEIFGPILPVLPYDRVEDAISYVNARARPLALYYFDLDRARAEQVLGQTHSGGACINDVMSHVAVSDMPFGGIGASGMGCYQGKEGFLAFSNLRGVVRKGRFNPAKLVSAPWGNRFYRAYVALQERRFRQRE
ncbi:MAG: aldehyde dehydrogenase family protein, partial [Pseudomonadota bacterium]